MAIDDTSSRAVTQVTVESESDSSNGWVYEVSVLWHGAGATDHRVSLRWVDHDHWTGGATEPSRLVEAVVALAGEVLGRDGLPEKFDLSQVIRRIPDREQAVRARIGGVG